MPFSSVILLFFFLSYKTQPSLYGLFVFNIVNVFFWNLLLIITFSLSPELADWWWNNFSKRLLRWHPYMMEGYVTIAFIVFNLNHLLLDHFPQIFFLHTDCFSMPNCSVLIWDSNSFYGFCSFSLQSHSFVCATFGKNWEKWWCYIHTTFLHSLWWSLTSCTTIWSPTTHDKVMVQGYINWSCAMLDWFSFTRWIYFVN